MTDRDTSPSAEEYQGDGVSARQRAIEAYSGARDRAASTLTEAPLIALAGGLAAGALIAALLPRTKAETRAVRPTARRLKETARSAFDAAKDTGSKRLDELGLNRQKGEQTIRSLLEGITDAAKASGQAAFDAARNKG
jgi:hypothetical protein